jgi:hypothetical protein
MLFMRLSFHFAMEYYRDARPTRRPDSALHDIETCYTMDGPQYLRIHLQCAAGDLTKKYGLT